MTYRTYRPRTKSRHRHQARLSTVCITINGGGLGIMPVVRFLIAWCGLSSSAIVSSHKACVCRNPQALVKNNRWACTDPVICAIVRSSYIRNGNTLKQPIRKDGFFVPETEAGP